MLRSARRRVIAGAAVLLAAGVGAGATALAASSSTEQFSRGVGIVSNRIFVTAGSGPNGDGSGALLLNLKGFGSFTTARCVTLGVPNSDQKELTLANTSEVPLDIVTQSGGVVGGTLAPGQSSTIFFGSGPVVSQLTLAGGSGGQRRVANVELSPTFDQTNNQCVFNIQAVAQTAS